MKIKLISLILILSLKSTFVYSMDQAQDKSNTSCVESKIDFEEKCNDEFIEKEETPDERIAKIQTYRMECLNKYLPPVLSDLILQYDLIKSKHYTEPQNSDHLKYRNLYRKI